MELSYQCSTNNQGAFRVAVGRLLLTALPMPVLRLMRPGSKFVVSLDIDLTGSVGKSWEDTVS